MKKFTLLTLFFCMSLARAQAPQENKAILVNLGVVYGQNISYRGALVWDAPFIAIGPSFVFFNTVALGAGGLSAFTRVGDYHSFALGIDMYNDDEPDFPLIKLKDSAEDFKNQRGSTFGTYFKYDFRLRQFVGFSLSYHKDLKRHKGNIYTAQLSTSIIPFVTLGVKTDYGDKDANQYAYGPEGVVGVGYIEQFASVMLPVLPWNGRLITKFSHSKIKKDQNVNADFVRGNKNHSNLSIITSWRF